MQVFSKRLRVGLWGICLCMVSATMGVPSEGAIREATRSYVVEGRQAEGIRKIRDFLGRKVATTPRISKRNLGPLAVAAECVHFMRLSAQAPVSADFAEWVLASRERLHLLIGNLLSADDPVQVFAVLDQLRQHDPEGAEAWFKLMVAIAVVMDHSDKPRIHGQMGDELPEYEIDPVARYDYFKTLYESGTAKFDYEALRVSELVFVVHTPVPISELEWAQKRVHKTLEKWGRLYHAIEYDDDRRNQGEYQWPHGVYTLRSIRQLGGICVDQAYYTVMCARAHGIPALYFSGSGKSANHAWCAYMKAPGDWVLDIGRYAGGEYTTGHAGNPQTRRSMTDHDVEYTCDRSLQGEEAEEALAYVLVAQVLRHVHPQEALRCARRARQLSKRMLPPWRIERQLLIKQKDYQGLLELFDAQKDVFRKYPDILVRSAQRTEKVLREAGKSEMADLLGRSLASAVKDERDDIGRTLECERIRELAAGGEFKKARRELEQMLDDQKEHGNKVIVLIRQYAGLIRESGQVHAGVKFLEDYVDELTRNYHFSKPYETRLLTLLAELFEEDGNERSAAEMRTRIERLQHR